jgi:hypothetical protein
MQISRDFYCLETGKRRSNLVIIEGKLQKL